MGFLWNGIPEWIKGTPASRCTYNGDFSQRSQVWGYQELGLSPDWRPEALVVFALKPLLSL